VNSKEIKIKIICKKPADEMGGHKLVAQLLITAALWVPIQTSLKNRNAKDAKTCIFAG
jgi:hypothetical protein